MADGNGGQLETRELGPGSSLVDFIFSAAKCARMVSPRRLLVACSAHYFTTRDTQKFGGSKRTVVRDPRELRID